MWFLPALIVITSAALSIPVGLYLAWIMDGRYRAPRVLRWFEERLNTGPQNWKHYAITLMLFNTVMFVFGFIVLSLQEYLPLNPDGMKALAPTTIFNTVTSFLTNTNLQDYSGEQHLSYFSQLFCIIWNMFVSASVGFCALSAIIRGLRGDEHMGNFYVDMWRAVVYVFLPSSLLMGVLLMAAGVPMTLNGKAEATTVEEASMGKAEDGKPLPQMISRGPVAALVPIKHLGTNGGGFFGANSAHPFENPSAWTNYLTCLNILIFPMSLVVMFGRMIGNLRHAAVIYGVMMTLFLVMIGWAISWDTLHPNPGLTSHEKRTDTVEAVNDEGKAVKPDPSIDTAAVAGLPVDQELGNLEGKELRYGTSAGATFSAVTTAVTCGSVNCMHDSLNPLAGLTPFVGMWLNCVFGGKGVGIVNLLLYLITGVFLAGLMVGRTPEYLGKKVEAREMKLAMLGLLAHPILVLGGTGLFAAQDWGLKATSNPGAHGFSQMLYQFSSSSANNGSGFEGLGDTWGFNDAKANNSEPGSQSPKWDIATGLVMLLGRFLPIIAPMALAGSLAAKKPTPFTAGTMRTDTFTFACVLLGTILLVGALLFLPAAVLGPLAEHLGPMPFGG
jgi:K+-transporting ATPase ATPase A chain